MKSKVAFPKTGLPGLLTVAVAMLSALPCRAFYNSQTGRWLSRDPDAEAGFHLLQRAANLPPPSVSVDSRVSFAGNSRSHSSDLGSYTALHNSPVYAIDKLGLKCCLYTIPPGHYQGGKSPYGHSILSCDDGAYISFSTESTGGWRNQEDDEGDYGPISTWPKPACSECLDGGKVRQWKVENENQWSWTPSANCADADLAAIEFALPLLQTKPQCPCISPDLQLKGCRSYARNVLQELPNGTSPVIVTPGDARKRAEELFANDCKKWKCTVSCIKYQFGGAP
jgi:hypothetical protein